MLTWNDISKRKCMKTISKPAIWGVADPGPFVT